MLLYDSPIQIAERKKLVSSIKSTLIDLEGSEQPYKSSPEAAVAETEGNNIYRDYKLQFLSSLLKMVLQMQRNLEKTFRVMEMPVPIKNSKPLVPVSIQKRKVIM